MNEKIKLDIQPPTSIYLTYQRLTYTIWHAIAEFVDNSTASYYSHKEVLKKVKNYKLKVYIIYQPDHGILTIYDNAFGMEIEDFKRAIILNSPPKDKSGRNEFGMGLKTAACWFGKEWEISSTRLGSNKLYSAFMDIEKLGVTNEKNINIHVEKINSEKHYTKLTIRVLSRKITSTQRKKVIEQISNIYRKDLINSDIEIKYIEKKYDKYGNPHYTNDGENFFSTMNEVPTLKYENPTVWEYVDEKTGLKEKYFQEFSDEIFFEGKTYHFNGFLAIRDIASRTYAGLTLIRRNRVIIGGLNSGYRPKEIFGDASDFAYQRIFGEVNMDNWPVTQAKNAFDWDNGLEEIFINKMKSISRDLVTKSRDLRKKDKVNLNLTSEQKILTNNLSIETMFKKPIGSLTIEEFNNSIKSNIISKNDLDSSAEKSIEKLSNYLVFKINDNSNREIHIDYLADMSVNPTEWLKINAIDQEDKKNFKFKITIFYEHPFFKPYINDGEFILVLKKFAIALGVSIINAQFSPVIKGTYQSLEIVKFMNDYLKQVIDEVN
ncbi:MAG: ATP-binding protein [Spiroplasma sp.]|nr:ATP-binding protein [Spiroplasma sp.]